MADEKETFLSSFKKQRQVQVDDVAESAQRLVNLYRHIDSFNGDFPSEFDKTLLSLTPEVLAAIPNFVGGATLRQYYDFLKGKMEPQATDTENTDKKSEQVGYLPSPAEDEIQVAPTQPIGEATQIEVLLRQLNEKHQQEIEKILKMQTDTLSQLMQRFDQNTHEVASHQTDRLINAMRSETNKKNQYSDIIEATGGDTPFVLTDEEEL